MWEGWEGTVWGAITGLLTSSFVAYFQNCQKCPAQNLARSFHPFVQNFPVISHISPDINWRLQMIWIEGYYWSYCLLPPTLNASYTGPCWSLNTENAFLPQGISTHRTTLPADACMTWTVTSFRFFPKWHLYNMALSVEIANITTPSPWHFISYLSFFFALLSSQQLTHIC